MYSEEQFYTKIMSTHLKAVRGRQDGGTKGGNQSLDVETRGSYKCFKALIPAEQAWHE